MKYIKHFLGWLFRYCPYGKGCPPEHPFRLKDKHDEDTKYYGSGHGQGGSSARGAGGDGVHNGAIFRTSAFDGTITVSGGAGGNLTSGGGC